MIEENLSALLGESADPVAAGYHLRELVQTKPEDAIGVFDAVVEREAEVRASDPAIIGGLLRVLHIIALNHDRSQVLSKLSAATLVRIEESLPKQTTNRYLMLHLLAMLRTPDALATLIDILKINPPSEWMEAAQVISPLMQTDDWDVGIVFPEILGCIASRSLAAPIIDLANYLTRRKAVDRHPAADQVQALNHLLGEVGNRLGKFEENPREFGDDVETVQDRLGQAVALAVSLCDAVGLIGDESSIGKLYQVAELRHRRVQCEAAGALARFDDELGRKRLIDLSADPAARLRAIHYADELEFGDLIEDQYRTDNATAEAELALWLSQPQQMGVPPTKVEVIETRRLLWPSFDDPVDVNLVRFEYNFGERQFSNVGMTGPEVFTLSADVADLPMDDIFAIYAGWHAEHEEIFSVAASEFNDAQLRTMQPYEVHLSRIGYEQLKPELLGFLLDEQAGVFRAVRDDTECLVVTDGLETFDHPVAGRSRPLEATDIFNLFKGRKMLRMFNP